MSTIKFYKYNGTGNDFIMIDNRDQHFDSTNRELINTLCTRHFGVGADGLILLENDMGYDFKMVYFNSDGNQSTMCGNGGRCIIQFAHDLKIIGTETTFIAIDGPHKGKVLADVISLQMQNVNNIKVNETRSELDTGSPHYVEFMNEIPQEDFVQLARKIRKATPYTNEGINVNFASSQNNKITMRTYERGVEDETLACGTGATAVAIAAHKNGLISVNSIPVKVKGGDLNISFDVENGNYENIWLTGPAQFVFEGKVKI
jgi:diaminopimelate epimerase